MKGKLTILWTSDNAETALLMVAMYASNAPKKGWFDEVTVIIWGGTNSLIRDNEEVQAGIFTMQSTGVTVKACKACADQIGTRELLESMKIEVDYMGMPLTAALKDESVRKTTFTVEAIFPGKVQLLCQNGQTLRGGNQTVVRRRPGGCSDVLFV